MMVMTVGLFVGCDKTPAEFPTTNTYTTNTITPSELKKALADNEILAEMEQYADATYSLPSEEWVLDTFAKSYSSFLYAIQSSRYVSEENDCDKFAVLAYAYAHILHHNTANKLSKTGFSFGEFWYETDTKGGHAINIIVVKDHNTNKVIFFEPQTKQKVDLSVMEKGSVKFVRF